MSAEVADGQERQMMMRAPRDSLSPRSADAFVGQYGSNKDVDQGGEVQPDESSYDNNEGKSTQEQYSHFTSPCQSHFDLTATPAAMATTQLTCSPRYFHARDRRPHELELDDSRGATSVSPSELRQLIKTAACQGTKISSRIQVVQHTDLQTPLPAKGRKRYPRPAALVEASVYVRQPAALPPLPRRHQMGNQQSHGLNADVTASSDDPRRKQVDRPISVLRKKIVTKPTPVAHKLTTTVIEVPRAATAPNLDLIDDDNLEWIDEKEKEKPIRHIKTLSEPSPALLSKPSSPVTITEELAARPLSAGTTITGLSIEDTSSVDALRVSALSPTLPAPSPVPEDSPHQYGLKDFTNTPTPPPDATKLKRRSNGIDIFKEAKSLQSAASFLNGLSNARRRAESRAMRDTTQSSKTYFPNSSTTSLSYGPSFLHSTPAYRSLTHLPLAEPPSPTSIESRPITPKLDDLSRTLGHTHKSSGFAYAKPLSLAQLRCYRKHDRLLRSGNKLYQVECAVCHKDQPEDYYWSCSWCALRMCEGCRSEFRKHGVGALKDKIRDAEYGAQ